jgi:arylsulfatase
MGFDFFYGYNCQRQAHTYYPPFLYRDENREYLAHKFLPPHITKLDKGADPHDEKSYAKFTQKQYSATLMYDEVLKFVDRAKDKPFFLYWASTLPHVALQAPERWVQHYVKKFGTEEPYLGRAKGGYFPCRYPRATYAAMVSYLDEQVGGLVAKLKELGLYENTVILFTSDNGPASSIGVEPSWFESARPFKSDPGWVKGTLHEGGIRMPMIVSWPGKIKPGSRTDHLSGAWDTMATVCELTNTKAAPGDGISFVPALLGKKQREHEYLYWEFPQSGGQKAIRMGKWKGLIQGIRNDGNAAMMLFDLEADPREQKNVAAEHPDIVKTLRKKMSEAHTDPVIERYKI